MSRWRYSINFCYQFQPFNYLGFQSASPTFCAYYTCFSYRFCKMFMDWYKQIFDTKGTWFAFILQLTYIFKIKHHHFNGFQQCNPWNSGYSVHLSPTCRISLDLPRMGFLEAKCGQLGTLYKPVLAFNHHLSQFLVVFGIHCIMMDSFMQTLVLISANQLFWVSERGPQIYACHDLPM